MPDHLAQLIAPAGRYQRLPSKSPHCPEIVIITSVDGVNPKGKMLAFVRDYRGRITGLIEDAELDMSDDVQFTGRMLDLLNFDA